MTDRKTLTVNDIEALAPQAKEYRVWDKTDGLCVRVSPKGKKTWSFSYRNRNGNKQTVRIGLAEGRGSLTPGEARKALRSLGDDPAAKRREVRQARQAKQEATQNAAQRTVRALLDETDGVYWKDELSRKRDGQGTRKRILAAWADILDADLVGLSELDLERVRRNRLKAGKLPQSLNRDWSALRAMLNFAKRRKLIDDFPHLKALDTHDDKRVRYLGQRDEYERQPLGERDRFLAAVNDPRTEPHLRIAALIAYWTGARRGEVFGLTWGEVSFAKEMITFRAHTSKSAKTRHVPLHAELKAVLQAWWQEQGEPGGSALVIPSPRTPATNQHGDPLTTVKRGWATLCRRAEIEDFHYHDLRHDFASRLVMRGASLDRVRSLLGHSTIQLTERYAHLAPTALQEAVALL